MIFFFLKEAISVYFYNFNLVIILLLNDTFQSICTYKDTIYISNIIKEKVYAQIETITFKYTVLVMSHVKNSL